MSNHIAYDKIPVQWMTAEQRQMEAVRRGLALNPNDPNFRHDQCLASVTVHATQFLTNGVRNRDEAKFFIEDQIRRMVLRTVYAPIAERNTELHRLIDMVYVWCRDLPKEEIDKRLAPVHELLSIVHPPRKIYTS